MGYYFALIECARCHLPFPCNPHKVPSVRVNGIKEGLCESCFTRLNHIRVSLNMIPWEKPEGAYEPVNENETEFNGFFDADEFYEE